MNNIYFDGGRRKGIGACGYIIYQDKNEVAWGGELMGKATNNEAEYRGLILALRRAHKEGIHSCKLFTDSKLVANQINGYYKINYPHLQRLVDLAKAELSRFDYWSIKWIPRKKNKTANWIVEYYFLNGNKYG